MSASAIPISEDRFAEAIAELPIGNLHAKAAELRNSIAHLVQSNEQLKPFAEAGDHDCVDAIKENEEVMEKMELRIDLLKREVQNRGLPWGEDVPTTVNRKLEHRMGQDQDHVNGVQPSAPQATSSIRSARTQGGTLGDEELARRLREQMDDDDGLYL
ncbi:MAG: hypothetical protein Q9166_000462 [cf. Caloplaca sp. 2 TL-2023]